MDFIKDNMIKVKAIKCLNKDEYRFVYILSQLDRGKVKSALNKEDSDKLMINEETDVNIQISN